MVPLDFNSMKCIWMSSGLVDYKLCGINFDCESCEFDKVMRGRAKAAGTTSKSVSVTDHIRGSLGNELSEHQIYLRNHIVLRKVYQNSYLAGFSPLLWDSLEPVEQLRLAAGCGFIRKGENFISAAGDWGDTIIPAPFDMYVVTAFAKAKAGTTRHSWLALIEVDEQSVAALTQTQEEHLRLSLQILQEETAESSELLNTMQDGGMPVRYLYQVIGRRRACALIRKLTNAGQ